MILKPELIDSITIEKYKDHLRELIPLYYPNISSSIMEDAIIYSINKRFKNSKSGVDNNYTHKKSEMSLLAVTDYINTKTPILTSQGVMFKHQDDVVNLLMETVQSFLDTRKVYKKKMLSYPKGTAEYAKFNLQQLLSKIDANSTYGALGAPTCMLFNVNVASSITTQGRALISSVTMCFEMMLDNNVKFGSLNEVVDFINNVKKDTPYRRFKDSSVLDSNIDPTECFCKVVCSCGGSRWIPNDNELDIIWKIINNLSQEDLNRVYYKNNLYAFTDNKRVFNLIYQILKKLNRPIYFAEDIPEEVQSEVKLFRDLVKEYVYYRYMIMDRIDRTDNMIKSITMISDTDSTIISLDGWYRYVIEKINGHEFRIANSTMHPIIYNMIKNEETKKMEMAPFKISPFVIDGKMDKISPFDIQPAKLDYNFRTDEVSEMQRFNNPLIITANDNVMYSIINILANVLGHCVNDYMEKACENFNSLRLLRIEPIPLTTDEYNTGNYYFPGLYKTAYGTNHIIPEIKYVYDRKCRINSKNEFTFSRIMMTVNKKNYVSLQTVQEGKLIPEDKQIDVKGIEILYKSTKSITTRMALQKIVLEDILKTPTIDQLKFIKDIAIFERSVMDSVKSGDRTFYKPAIVKSQAAYKDPMRIQGVKASIAWNEMKPNGTKGIDLTERNAVDIAKVNINKTNADIIAGDFPEVYANIVNLLNDERFKGSVNSIAIPLDVEVPEWLTPFIDYDSILRDNIAGFPFSSIGIERLNRNKLNYTNIVKL